MRIPRIAVSPMLDKLFCRHTNVLLEDKQLVCEKCGVTWPISDALTRSSGVFLRIDQRLEQTAELSRLIKLAEAYQSDKEYQRDIR